MIVYQLTFLKAVLITKQGLQGLYFDSLTREDLMPEQ